MTTDTNVSEILKESTLNSDSEVALYYLKSFADTAREPILIFNPDLRIVGASAPFYKNCGIVMKYATNTTRVHQGNMLAASIPLINIGSTRLGDMDPAEWDQVQNTLIENKLLSKPITIGDAYTLQFLKNLYTANQ